MAIYQTINAHSYPCNDYSLQNANTGIVGITTANPYLNGRDARLAFTAGAHGSIIKAVNIKAVQPVTTGMVRLFIANADSSVISLYKEVPVSTSPSLSSVPLPNPVLPTFEVRLPGDITLSQGFRLLASTQTNQDFTVIVEGLDRAYPATLPSSPFNFEQYFASLRLGIVSVANTNLNGMTGTYVPVFVGHPGKKGSIIKSITIKALQNTHPGMVRLFVAENATANRFLLTEVVIPQTGQSAYTPSFKQTLMVDYYLQAGYYLFASTELSESFAITVEGMDWNYPIS